MVFFALPLNAVGPWLDLTENSSNEQAAVYGRESLLITLFSIRRIVAYLHWGICGDETAAIVRMW
jgi:hypothetical protein